MTEFDEIDAAGRATLAQINTAKAQHLPRPYIEYLIGELHGLEFACASLKGVGVYQVEGHEFGGTL